jgi:hypothetical protein
VRHGVADPIGVVVVFAIGDILQVGKRVVRSATILVVDAKIRRTLKREEDEAMHQPLLITTIARKQLHESVSFQVLGFQKSVFTQTPDIATIRYLIQSFITRDIPVDFSFDLHERMS